MNAPDLRPAHSVRAVTIARAAIPIATTTTAARVAVPARALAPDWGAGLAGRAAV